MKRKIDKYDPVVYPRLLWVATEITDLDNVFVFCNINDFTKENPDTYKNLVEDYETGCTSAMTIPVIHKSSGRSGVLVLIFDLDSDDLSNTIPHEATHVTDYIFDSLGLSADVFSRNECYAYLLGWAASCISSSVIKFNE
jgi:hypothetical protein